MRDREGRSHKSFWKTGELVVWVTDIQVGKMHLHRHMDERKRHGGDVPKQVVDNADAWGCGGYLGSR